MSDSSTTPLPLHFQFIAESDYRTIWEQMRAFTDTRTSDTADEIWFVEHDPVFTQGQNGRPEHLLNPGNIPVVETDRGGQITYHGPGQLVAYILIDLRRRGLSVRPLVTAIEQAIIHYLADLDIKAMARCDAPGVYVGAAKICSLGLRIRRGHSYHGLAFNVNMDLSPFKDINPCGFKNLSMTQLRDFGHFLTPSAVALALQPHLERALTPSFSKAEVSS